MAPINRNLLLPIIFLAATLSIVLVAARSREVTSPTQAASSAAKEPATSVLTSRGDPALARDIDRVLDESGLVQARWGVVVKSLTDGQVLYSRNGDKLFTPASNMKIYTTAVTLDMLGADYRWRTSVYANKQPDANGIIDGDIVLYGRGAPDLSSDRKEGLASLADQIYQRGVRRVRGNVIGDESYFRGELYGLGWQWNDLQWYFGAEPSALSINQNSISLTISPASKAGSAASLTLDRQSDYLHLTNNTMTGPSEVATTIGINRGLSDNELRVWGGFPSGGRPFSAYLSVPRPALWAATLFKEALAARGIKVDGATLDRDSRVAEIARFDPQKSFELAGESSKTLGEIIRQTNKESNNLFAELILRTLGKERGTSSPDPNPRKDRERGDDEAGLAVVRMWLTQHSISTEGLGFRDGSGLSRLDLVTPEATAGLLEAIARTGSASVFRDSLPIAGRDGTLSMRLMREVGKISAKTGSLTYDHSLSGYANARNGEVLVFSIFCNDATGHTNPVGVIDQIAALLVGLEQPHPTKNSH